MNTPMPPFEDPSDARLHAALRNLPDHRAPDSLLPGVLAAIRAREQAAAVLSQLPWYRRPATSWPAPLRIALGTAALGLLAALAFVPQLIAAVTEDSPLRAAVAASWARLEVLLGALAVVGEACVTVLRESANSPYMLGAAAVIILSYFALLGIGGVVWRTASQSRQP